MLGFVIGTWAIIAGCYAIGIVALVEAKEELK